MFYATISLLRKLICYFVGGVFLLCGNLELETESHAIFGGQAARIQILGCSKFNPEASNKCIRYRAVIIGQPDGKQYNYRPSYLEAINNGEIISGYVQQTGTNITSVNSIEATLILVGGSIFIILIPIFIDRTWKFVFYRRGE